VEENNDWVIEERWPLAVMVTFEFNEILITCIGCMKFFWMMRLDEIVGVASGKECGDEALIDMAYGSKIIYVEIRFASDRTAY